MRKLRSERGGVSVGLIIAILVGFFLLYEGLRFGPLLIAQFQFQDAVMEAAKFSRGLEARAVREGLMEKVRALQLPITPDMIKVDRKPQHTRIIVTYELEEDWLPGKPYKWQVTVDEESILF